MAIAVALMGTVLWRWRSSCEAVVRASPARRARASPLTKTVGYNNEDSDVEGLMYVRKALAVERRMLKHPKTWHKYIYIP